MAEEVVTSLGRDAGTAVLQLHGEIDVMTVDQVRGAMADALASSPRVIEVDLSDLQFIDSTGLGAIVFGFQRCRDAGVGFRLTRPTPSVRQILVLSGLLEVVEMTDTP